MNIVLVDSDVNMLNWAQQRFSLGGLCVKTVCTTVEELAGDYLKLNDKIETPSFDMVLLSYVIQHIDPVYYPLVFDFCKCISKKYVVIDVFWNPTRLELGEFAKIGSISWYGNSKPLSLFSLHPFMIRAYDPIIDGQTILQFEYNAKNNTFIDKQTKSEWNFEGKAISGQMRGNQLIRLPFDQGFWFEWVAFHQISELYNGY